MFTFIKHKKPSLRHKILCSAITLTFLFSSMVLPTTSYAQGAPLTVLNLPVPGTMVSATSSFMPVLIKGLNLYPGDPLKFDFIVDKGDTHLENKTFEEESAKLIKYFMAALTIPEDQMWVNLSPYEKDRIIPQSFGETEMGRDLLAQDYLLKQLASSLMYPEDELGKKFWDKVRKQAYKKFGTTEIPMNTFNKIWIVPQEAMVYEHSKGAFVVKSHLKIMLEEDYLALKSNIGSTKHGLGDVSLKDIEVLSGVSSQVIKEVLIPEIEREVNEGKTFANLRQVYNSVILATWYKHALKESLLGQVYVDQNKTRGVETQDKEINQKIYERYIEAFKKGVYDYIKEDYDPATKEIIPRKYFSGGADLAATHAQTDITFEGEGSSPVRTAAINAAAARLEGDNMSVVTATANEILGEGSSPVAKEELHHLPDKYFQGKDKSPSKRLQAMQELFKRVTDARLTINPSRNTTVLTVFAITESVYSENRGMFRLHYDAPATAKLLTEVTEALGVNIENNKYDGKGPDGLRTETHTTEIIFKEQVENARTLVLQELRSKMEALKTAELAEKDLRGKLTQLNTRLNRSPLRLENYHLSYERLTGKTLELLGNSQSVPAGLMTTIANELDLGKLQKNYGPDAMNDREGVTRVTLQWDSGQAELSHKGLVHMVLDLFEKNPDVAVEFVLNLAVHINILPPVMGVAQVMSEKQMKRVINSFQFVDRFRHANFFAQGEVRPEYLIQVLEDGSLRLVGLPLPYRYGDERRVVVEQVDDVLQNVTALYIDSDIDSDREPHDRKRRAASTVESALFLARLTDTTNEVTYVKYAIEDGYFLPGIEVPERELPDDIKARFGITASSPVGEDDSPLGGIDLNPNEIDMQLRKEGKGVVLPFVAPELIEQFRNVIGFSPIIINIAPGVNLPLLLGFDTKSSNELMSSTDSDPLSDERCPDVPSSEPIGACVRRNLEV